MNCSAKLEQDLHVSRANYALSTVLTGANMLSFLGDNAQNLKSVDPLAALYPGAYSNDNMRFKSRDNVSKFKSTCSVIRKIEYVCPCIHFKDLKTLE